MGRGSRSTAGRSAGRATRVRTDRRAPPTLYLDSNDFSRFADERRPEFQAPYKALLDAVRGGRLVCTFSALHVMEAIHTAPEHRQLAVRRAEVIRQLCGRHCLMFWHDLVAAEAMAVAGGPAVTRDVVQRSDGLWIPVPDIDPAGFDATMLDARDSASRMMHGVLRASGLPRQQRRKLARDALSGRLATSPQRGQPLPQEGLSEKERLLLAHLDSVNVAGLAFGRGSTAQAAREVKAFILDVPTFVGHLYDGHPDLHEIFGMLRSTGTVIRAAAEQARHLAAKFAATDRAIVRSELEAVTGRFAADTKAKVLAQLCPALSSHLEANGLRMETWAEKVMLSALGTIPSLDTFLTCMAAHLRRSTLPGANRKLLASDLADLFHAMYLPYVDGLRCDLNTAEVLRPAAEKHGTRLLSRLDDVPAWLASLPH